MTLNETLRALLADVHKRQDQADSSLDRHAIADLDISDWRSGFTPGVETVLAQRHGLSWLCSRCTLDMTNATVRDATKHYYAEHGTAEEKARVESGVYECHGSERLISDVTYEPEWGS